MTYIDIITEDVEMPVSSQQKYQIAEIKKVYAVIDSMNNNQTVYLGAFDDAMIAKHNLNKKYYLGLNNE